MVTEEFGKRDFAGWTGLETWGARNRKPRRDATLASKSAWGRQNDERLRADSSWAVRGGAAQCRHAGGTDHECRSEGDAGGNQEADLRGRRRNRRTPRWASEDAHLMADRRAGEAEQAGGGLEGAQGIEGRQRGVHPGHHIH